LSIFYQVSGDFDGCARRKRSDDRRTGEQRDERAAFHFDHLVGATHLRK
jgi:hypothetical protein